MHGQKAIGQGSPAGLPGPAGAMPQPPDDAPRAPHSPLHLQHLKDQIAHDEYVVDAYAVAGALLRTAGPSRALNARRAPGARFNRDDARSRPPGRDVRPS